MKRVKTNEDIQEVCVEEIIKLAREDAPCFEAIELYAEVCIILKILNDTLAERDAFVDPDEEE